MINYNMNRVLSALAAFVGIDKMPVGSSYAKRRPTGAALRNPSCPFQAERIAKAQAKRERRALVAMRNSARAWVNNHVWIGLKTMPRLDRLRPFTINREV